MSSKRKRTIFDELKVLLGSRTRADEMELQLYGKDSSVLSGVPSTVCFPVNVEEVQGIVSICNRFQRPFIARGSGTGLAGGAVPIGNPVIISTAKMNKVLEIDLEDRLA